MNNPFELASFAEGNVDALIKANKVAAKGLEQLSSYFFAFATKSFEENIEAAKKLSMAKSPADFAEIQVKLAQDSLQIMIDEAKKISELAASIVKEASEPLTKSLKPKVAAASKEGTKK